MTLQQLLENAHLDALGLLDESEQEAFDRAYRAAPPAIREQIRAEQARWAEHAGMLPEVAPPAGLRDRVLAAVAAAAGEQVEDEPVLVLEPVQRVSKWWRVGAIGLATAAVALGSAFVYVSGTNESLRDALATGERSDQLLTLFGRGESGVEHIRGMVLDAGATRVLFTPTAVASESRFAGRMSVFTSTKWKDALVCFELPRSVAEEQYKLVVVSDKGEVVETLRTFASDGTIQSFAVTALEAGTRLALVAVKPGEAVRLDRALLTAVI